MPQIVPIRDLRNTNEISQLCHAKDEPIFVTKNGYGDLVVMSMKTYESLTKISDIDNAISSSEAKIKDEENLLDAKDALKSLHGKYFE
ncbi:type II toxin-antitoxin system prevent-host-death family antitoxin [Campylobacter concisus]|jgi:prevent-host-death family protein|uniref:type II toxin-antitoxin system prevent-host-death family antitoxin n=1 Tax=Campylobacter concisus TaxID=199 RepID=UPI000CD86B68|nr:type II toxin-antitoxin system prevent-host-death family antitoxin [Campylobacter concisus]